MGSVNKLAVLAATGIAVALAVALVLMRAPAGTKSATSAEGTCVPRLMQDWRDGRIDGTYPLPCYQQAISKLPADVRIYSSAEQDIRQARAARIVQRAGGNARTPS